VRRRRRWLVATALSAVVAAAGIALPAGSAAAESNGGVRVMPLGDSITEGTQVPGGYRIGLWQRTAAAGYRVDLVGSQFNGPTALGDHDHEGHPGWRIDQIDANISGWLGSTSPRSVLLHIGTNDVLQNYNLGGAPNRLSTLIDHITVWYAALRAVPGAVGDPGTSTGGALVGAASGRCLDVPGGNTANGTQPIIWDCSGAANQHWTNYGQTLQALGKCLDAPTNATAGAKAQLWDCHGGTNQRWTLSSDGTIRGAQSGLCLDVDHNLTANGAVVLLWTCSAAANQRWSRV